MLEKANNLRRSKENTAYNNLEFKFHKEDGFPKLKSKGILAIIW